MTTRVLELALEDVSLAGVQVLGPLDLSLARGETLALTGPSGVGKTTLLRVVAGLQEGFAGRCFVRGRAAMIFQEPILLPWRSARDNIVIAAGVSDAEADAALGEVGLGDQGDAFPSALSLGQQRRLSLARAFAVKPDLLLMDEPFVSLDQEMVEEMMSLFIDLRTRHGVATIFVTHSMEEARKLGDRVVTLGGSPAQIASETRNDGG